MNKYEKGDIVKAKITAIEGYGAFASLDEEYSGLIHISELTENFVRDISDFVKIGDIVNVEILEISEIKNQLKLSAKGINEELYRKNSNKIKETVFGFYLLKKALPGWIDKKMAEISKKSKNMLDNSQNN